jgi:hypothetical protein
MMIAAKMATTASDLRNILNICDRSSLAIGAPGNQSRLLTKRTADAETSAVRAR